MRKICLSIILFLVYSAGIYAGSWRVISLLEYTTIESGTSRVAEKIYTTKIRVTFTEGSNEYAYFTIKEQNSYPHIEICPFFYEAETGIGTATANTPYKYYVRTSAEERTGYDKLYKQGTKIENKVYEFDLNALAGTTDKYYYVSSWQKNINPAKIEVYEEVLFTAEAQTNDAALGRASVEKEVKPYVGFTALEASTIKLQYGGTVVGAQPKLEYSYDTQSWSTFSLGTTYDVAEGQTFYLRGSNPRGVCFRPDGYSYFVMTGSFDGTGDIMSMVDSTFTTTTAPSYCFYRLFLNCTALRKAPRLTAKTLDSNCYAQLFKGCTNLQYIEADFTSWGSSNAYTPSWLYSASTSGTFVKPEALPVPSSRGTSNIPSGWTIETHESSQQEQQSLITSGQFAYGDKVVFTATPNANSRFVQWNDGNTANPRTIVLTQDTVLTAVFERVPKQTGALLGVFAIAEDKYVCFSQGNLQYSPNYNYYGATGSWQFASTQYEYRGTLNQTDRTVIDLIGWGATGYNSTVPPSTSKKSSDYAPNNAPLTGTNYDWGKYCSIGYGGNKPGLWRTMDHEEWEYLINGRPNAQIHKGKATVVGVKGYVFLPEEWQCPASLSFSSAMNDYTDNVYSESQWMAMEKAGAVFLPAQGGYRSETMLGQYETEGWYWTAGTDGYTLSDKKFAYALVLSSSPYIHSSWTFLGAAIRLVCDTAYVPAKYTITTSANPEHGSVTGGGAYNNGASAQLTAIPAECYEFVQWNDGNTDNPRVVEVTDDATYTAQFKKTQFTVKGRNAATEGGNVQVVEP